MLIFPDDVPSKPSQKGTPCWFPFKTFQQKNPASEQTNACVVNNCSNPYPAVPLVLPSSLLEKPDLRQRWLSVSIGSCIFPNVLRGSSRMAQTCASLKPRKTSLINSHASASLLKVNLKATVCKAPKEGLNHYSDKHVEIWLEELSNPVCFIKALFIRQVQASRHTM